MKEDMITIKKVTALEPLKDAVLSLEFSSGVTKKYDVKTLYKNFPELEDLVTWGIFHWAEIESSKGHAVIWTPDHDISANELWHNGY